MIGNNQLCSICNSESASIACVCDKEIKIIGSQCLPDHLRDTAAVHDLVDVELALRMRTDFSLFSRYLIENSEIAKVLNSLKLYSFQVGSSKQHLGSERSRLFARLEEVFLEISKKLEDIDKETQFNIKQISDYKRTLSEEGRALLHIYQSEGIQKLFKSYFEKLHLPVDMILEYISQHIFIQYSGCNQLNIHPEQTELQEKTKRIEELSQECKNQSREIERFREMELEYNENKIRIDEYESELEDKNSLIGELGIVISLSAETEKNLKKEISRLAKDIKNLEVNSSSILSQYQTHTQSQIRDYEQTILNTKNAIYQLEQNNQKLQTDLKLAQNKLNSHEEVKQLRNRVQNKPSEESKELPSKTLEPKQLKGPQVPSNLAEVNYELELEQHFHKFSGKRHIYVPIKDQRFMTFYDLHINKSASFHLENLDRDFSLTSSCELPNGDVFLCGFCNPISGNAYLYLSVQRQCIRLPDMKYARFLISLHFHNDYVYAFGGVDSKKAERFSLKKNSWENLPNMNNSREYVSCVGIGNLIYLFSGSDKTIQAFDTVKLQFRNFKLKNAETSKCYGVAFRVNNSIYLLTDSIIQIYDTQLKKKSQFTNRSKNNSYSLNNIIRHEEDVYFYNEYTQTVEKINTRFPNLSRDSGSSDSNVYLYRTIDNSKSLLRVNLANLSMEVKEVNMPRNFMHSSVCLLENGLVLIAGFCVVVSRECFLYDPHTNTISKMHNLNIPRYFIGLIYHSNNVYAFGGRDASGNALKSTERFNTLSRNSWMMCNNMLEARSLPSCIGFEDKIYITGGGVLSIEIYDIATDSYQFTKERTSHEFIVSFLVNDSVFILGDNYEKMLLSNLKPSSEMQMHCNIYSPTYTTGNIQILKDKVYFYNSATHALESINIHTHVRGIETISYLHSL